MTALNHSHLLTYIQTIAMEIVNHQYRPSYCSSLCQVSIGFSANANKSSSTRVCSVINDGRPQARIEIESITITEFTHLENREAPKVLYADEKIPRWLLYLFVFSTFEGSECG